MAEILTFPKGQMHSSPQQHAETKEEPEEFFVFETDDLLSFSRGGHTERQTIRSRRLQGSGWSNQELASIYRVKHLLDAAKMRTELDRGISDEGEPWCVFCNGEGEVFLHLSRIDGLYWLDSPNLPAPLHGRSFDELVNGFTNLSQETDGSQTDEGGQQKLVRLHSSDRLFLHPSVMLAALVWSLYFGSEELLLFGPQDTTDEEETGLGAASGYDVKAGALMDSAMAKGDDASWHDSHAQDLQKSLLAAGAQSHLGMMLGLGSIAVASGIVSESQWKEIFSFVFPWSGDQDTQTASTEEGASEMDILSLLTQSLNLISHVLGGEDAEYAGESGNVNQADTETASTSLIATKLAELLDLDKTSAYQDFDSLEVFQNKLKDDAVHSGMKAEYAVLEGTIISSQDVTAEGGEANVLTQPGIITKLFESLVGGNDLAAFEFGGTQYLADFSLQALKSRDTDLLEQMLVEPELDTVFDPIEAPIISTGEISDTASVSSFSAFDDRAKDFLLDLAVRGDVNFVASSTALIFFDLEAYGGPDTEVSGMTWQTDDGMTISFFGATADFLDYGFV